jgi:hypothetical protein
LLIENCKLGGGGSWQEDLWQEDFKTGKLKTRKCVFCLNLAVVDVPVLKCREAVPQPRIGAEDGQLNRRDAIAAEKNAPSAAAEALAEPGIGN